MAHIPDGFLSAPVLLSTAAASAAALAVAARRSRALLAEREVPLLGALTAFVFAAQMFNFPLAAGTSAHLLGGVLVAALAGPWVGMLVIFAVVLVQALLFQDGGIAALGANTLNLAVLGAGGGWLAYRWLLALLGARARVAAAAGAAFLSTLLTGVGVALELALSGVVPARPALLVVGGAHVLVGLGEALLTGGILALVWRARPELAAAQSVPTRVLRAWTRGLTALALLVAVGAGYLASARPDVLEAAAVRFGLRERPLHSPPLAGYEAPFAEPWLIAVAGVAAVFLCGWLLLRRLAQR
jgi:cobalt/nickel transport system permease protein